MNDAPDDLDDLLVETRDPPLCPRLVDKSVDLTSWVKMDPMSRPHACVGSACVRWQSQNQIFAEQSGDKSAAEILDTMSNSNLGRCRDLQAGPMWQDRTKAAEQRLKEQQSATTRSSLPHGAHVFRHPNKPGIELQLDSVSGCVNLCNTRTGYTYRYSSVSDLFAAVPNKHSHWCDVVDDLIACGRFPYP